MKWIKDAILDLLILVVIVAYAITSNDIIEIIIWVYTSLLIISKVSYFFFDFLQSKASKTKVPDWFYHGTYLLSIILLLTTNNYPLLIAWVVIWVLSVVPKLVKTKKKSS